MPDRLPLPGPSYLKELELRVGERTLHAGIARPTTGPDDWWLAVAWVHDDDGVVSFRDVAPPAGPPPEPPLARLGPALSGALSGLILEEDGRLSVRLGLVVPPDEPDRPWRAALAVRAGFKWEPARAATMTPNQLASEVLRAFGRSVEGLAGHRAPGR